VTTTTTPPAADWLAAGIAETWSWDKLTLHRVPGVRTHPGGLVAVVSLDGLPHAVTRVLPPGHVSVTAVESEVAWMQALGRDGVVRVPTVLSTRTGTAVGVLEGPRGARWVAVSMSYDPVIASPPAPGGDLATLRELGALASRLHEHARAWEPPTWFRRPSLELVDLTGPASGIAWEDQHLSATALNLLGTAQEEALDTVSWAGEPHGLVHGDLRDAMARDLLRTFECRWTWWEQDLAGSLSGLEAEIRAPSLVAAWLEGYDGALDHHLTGALVMLRRLALLSSDPDLVDGTLDVATRYLRSPTWLVD
jgi:Ser/Thr protein kinase RdoA (MazF antagonist)